jgi:hypothetical protein
LMFLDIRTQAEVQLQSHHRLAIGVILWQKLQSSFRPIDHLDVDLQN